MKVLYFLNYFLKVTKTFDQMSPLSHGRSEALLNILLVMNLILYIEQTSSFSSIISVTTVISNNFRLAIPPEDRGAICIFLLKFKTPERTGLVVVVVVFPLRQS